MLKIALIGKRQEPRTSAAFCLNRQHGFKKLRMDDGVSKTMRFFYLYRKNERPKWEQRMKIYDALYKIDPKIHINYMMWRLSTTTTDVVIEDVRYIAELQVLKDAGFKVVRITSPEKLPNFKMVRQSAAGTLKLQEYFNAPETIGYSADYSVFYDKSESSKKNLADIVDILRKDNV